MFDSFLHSAVIVEFGYGSGLFRGAARIKSYAGDTYNVWG